MGEFDDSTGDQFIVAAQPAAGTTVTVRRGHNNTTAAAHTLATTVLKGFFFSYDQISNAITNTFGFRSANTFVIAAVKVVLP